MSFGGKSFHEEVSGMRPYELGDVNKLAGIGFFLSLIGADVMGLLLYCGQKNYGSFTFCFTVRDYCAIDPIDRAGFISQVDPSCRGMGR